MSESKPYVLVNTGKKGLPNTKPEKEEKQKMHMRHFTNDLVKDWTWERGVGFVLAQIVGTTIVMYAQMNGKFWYESGFGDAFTMAWIMGGAVLFAQGLFGKWTSLPLDMFRAIGDTVRFMATRAEDLGDWRIWLEPLKLIIVLICQWLATMIAMSILGASTGTVIKTDDVLDCTTVTPIPAVCVVYPELTLTAATNVTLCWQEVLAMLIIYGAYVVAEEYIGFVKKWQIVCNALLYGVAYFFVFIQFGVPSGGSFNVWYVLDLSWFSGLTDNLAQRIWPNLLGVAIVVIISVVFFYMYKYLVNRHNEKMERYKEA